ncbi:hypothetical protein CDEF62S_04307 [Castellaniella defragrans]
MKEEARLDFSIRGGIPVLLLVVAFLLALVSVGSCWYTLLEIARWLREAWPVGAAWANVVLLVLGVVAAALFWPCVRAWNECLASRRARLSAQRVLAREKLADVRVSCFVTIGYSVAVLLIVLLVQFFLLNDHAVAKTFLDVALIVKTFPLILSAFWLNVKLFVASGIVCLIFGLVLAIAEIAPGPAGRPLRMLATAYVDVFRAIPAILVLFLVAFGIPLTGVPLLSDMPQMVLMVIALSITVSAYMAEIYRAGILSVQWSQAAAARSLGMTYLQSLRHVIVPQGVRNIIPPLLNSLIALQKDTALVTVVGAIDAFNQSMIIAGNVYNLSAVTTVAILFIIVSIPQTRLVERMMQRDRMRRMRA